MTRIAVRILVFLGVIAALPAGCAYYFLRDGIFYDTRNRRCITDNPKNTFVESNIAKLINGVLNDNGVKDLVSVDNIVCYMSDGFQDIDMAVLVDPTKDALFSNYRQFVGGQIGKFEFKEKEKIANTTLEYYMRQKLPLDFNGYMNYYIKYLNEIGGDISVRVSGDGERPLLLIVYSTSW